ncbi:adenosylcobinamide-GDP ribazoletransferase [Rhodococcus sp. HNM0569]|uniref:adenosylcobinamide-GDP ribazoletransferase n=1 Tax=Rhodococcus sp. HNM0569 TaxID=2716340 RepID=UPI00146CB55A|nr:adenosylcobinamide-GDP ribazoletransferase [Rhodococcus sp. HNM0569]NLU82870.1 adenosylcobinamide-GDP ribazoletransferase [Rhodococcus sp. HNM0569]
MPATLRGAVASVSRGVITAFSWLTVLPVHGPVHVDRRVARGAIAAAPVVGILLGALAAAVATLVAHTAAPPLVTGLVVVGVLALATRGMHVDGLSDTADGLGCYGPPDRARAVMKDGGAGPFGVATLFVVLGLQAAALGELAARGDWAAVLFAVAAGRVAVVVLCARGTRAATTSGFGALVAGTQAWGVLLTWTALLVVAGVFVAPEWWRGPVAAAAALVLVVLGARHCTRRFGGLVGDVLGAATELTVAVAAVVLVL